MSKSSAFEQKVSELLKELKCSLYRILVYSANSLGDSDSSLHFTPTRVSAKNADERIVNGDIQKALQESLLQTPTNCEVTSPSHTTRVLFK